MLNMLEIAVTLIKLQSVFKRKCKDKLDNAVLSTLSGEKIVWL